ncbi:DJ-1/PfpI family protein [Serratia sp. DD3]|uniref:DJ-1/PfpI family protein n=1 Tax=Serratia sp. DD3 TaxID=1410619 RepID=UPI0003C50FD6|nr:DJ-1/PfpI family protein [Serratia sp. DD3]KEY58965.1 chaperone protein YajL [Serratia sp. DD3]
MTKKVAVLLSEGFEEAEAVIVIDVLRRMDIEVELLSCQDRLELRSYHQMRMFADALLERRKSQLYDAVVIPGGPKATIEMAENALAVEFIRRHDQAAKLICPLSSAAALVLAANGMLRGRRYVCSDGLHLEIEDGTYVAEKVVEDGNLISGQGLGAAFDFAFTIGYRLTGDPVTTQEQATHIYHENWQVPLAAY